MDVKLPPVPDGLAADQKDFYQRCVDSLPKILAMGGATLMELPNSDHVRAVGLAYAAAGYKVTIGKSIDNPSWTRIEICRPGKEACLPSLRLEAGVVKLKEGWAWL